MRGPKRTQQANGQAYDGSAEPNPSRTAICLNTQLPLKEYQSIFRVRYITVASITNNPSEPIRSA